MQEQTDLTHSLSRRSQIKNLIGNDRGFLLISIDHLRPTAPTVHGVSANTAAKNLRKKYADDPVAA